MTRVAVTSRSFSLHPVLHRELLDRYPDATFNDDGLKLAGNDLVAFLKGHDKAITALEVLDADVFKALPELTVFSKYGVGFDMIDLDAMAAAGVRLGWTGGTNKRSVSELVIAFAVQLLRHTPEASAQVQNGVWRQHVGRQLSDRTVGIIGCGHVGKDLAILLRAFGCRVLAHDILDFPEFYTEHGIEPVGLKKLLMASDVVTLHLPLDDTTRNMITAKQLALMKPDAILINAARGGLMDEAALKAALKEGRLGGAALDVFAAEPPDDRKLLQLANVIVTPHLGGSAEEAILAMGRAAIDGLDKNRVPEKGVFPTGY
ncbi:MAG: phosphoglycerate dehydrogenase [Proteobacteria bacterium]|nr:phosphoglycerate dehydrogenase [Pseudomonadota bacterium]